MEFLDYSQLIKDHLKPYLHLFITESCYYEDSYGLFLKEVKDPFRIISIFHNYQSNLFEVRSEITNVFNSTQLLYSIDGIQNLEDCIKIASKVILGYDLIKKLENKWNSIKSIK